MFKIVECHEPEYLLSIKLRERILRQPLGLQFSEAELASEKQYIKIVGIIDADVIATALLIHEEGTTCKMRQVAVSENLSGMGIGSKLLQFCENHARKYGFSIMYCHARQSAVHFYLKNSYQASGDYFEEQTIPHIRMFKNL